jgi:hypothetical protein
MQQILQNHPERLPPAKWELSGPISDTAGSVVYRGQSSAFPHPVAIKIYRQSRERPMLAQTIAQREYQNYSRVYPAMAGTFNGVPRPLVLLEREAVMLTEYIELPRLREQMVGFKRYIHDPWKRIKAAAGWLNSYHNLGIHEATIDEQQTSADWLRSKPLIPAIPCLRDPLWNRSMDVLKELGGDVSKCQTGWSIPHGDFSAHNLLYGDNRIVGLDMSRVEPEPILRDCLKFIVFLELTKPFMEPKRTLESRNYESPEAAYFLEYYGTEKLGDYRLPFEFMKLERLMFHWYRKSKLTYFKKPVQSRFVLKGERMSSIADRYFVHRVKTCIRCLLKRL